MNLTDKDVARLLADKLYSPSYSEKENFAINIFIESLVLPEGCSHYGRKEMEKYILYFMHIMKQGNPKSESPPKDKRILAVIDFCGRRRINVVFWNEKSKEWRTDMQLNSIDEPIFWWDLPGIPKKLEVSE